MGQNEDGPGGGAARGGVRILPNGQMLTSVPGLRNPDPGHSRLLGLAPAKLSYYAGLSSPWEWLVLTPG